jgi:hypothetical protein
MKIGILPSSQKTSTGSGIGNHNERELMIDLSARLLPKLRAAGHEVEQFLATTEVGSDGAYALVKWNPQICIDLHLDSAGGAPAALLCYQEQRSLQMGLTILNVYCISMSYRNKGGMLRTPGINGVAVIRIPEQAGIPTALIECGDMDAPDGYDWVKPEHREKAAVALSKAICAYAGGAGPIPQTKEDKVSLYQGPMVSPDGKTFTYLNCWQDKFNYYLITDGVATNMTMTLKPEKGTPKTTNGQAYSGLKVHNLQDVAKGNGIVGSYKLTAHSDTPLEWAVREDKK